MTDHHQLTGKFAVHQFAFVQNTDPALDPDNEVLAYKAWIDTSSGNALKVRNAANTAWNTVIAGGGGISQQFVVRFPYANDLQILPNSSEMDQVEITYV